MYRLYKKNELNFSLMLIGVYVVLNIAAENISGLLGLGKIIAASVNLILTVILFVWIKKHALSEEYGLCPFGGSKKDYLYFIPLLIIASVNLWNGAAMNLSFFESVLFVLSMLCVGFLEEVIFRGFLFKSICKDNVKQAILISSLTFGLGHITSLLNGRDILPTLLQICYATAIGFLFTVIFYKGKSLLPCIITHGVLNSLSAFAVEASVSFNLISDIVLCVLSVGYALWILKKSEKIRESEKTQKNLL